MPKYKAKVVFEPVIVEFYSNDKDIIALACKIAGRELYICGKSEVTELYKDGVRQ